jgi:hypothetical protein
MGLRLKNMVEKKRISFIIKSFETLEVAGVKVRKAFGNQFLAMD